MMSKNTVRANRAREYAEKYTKLSAIYSLCAQYGISVPQVDVSSHVETLDKVLQRVQLFAAMLAG